MRKFTVFILLALSTLASAGSSSQTQTVTLQMGKIQTLMVTSPSGGVAFSWSNSDWVAGQLTNSKVANAGSLAYSVNVKSKMTVRLTDLPVYVDELLLSTNGGINFSNSARVFNAGQFNANLPIKWKATANLIDASPYARTDVVTATFTLLDF